MSVDIKVFSIDKTRDLIMDFFNEYIGSYNLFQQWFENKKDSFTPDEYATYENFLRMTANYPEIVGNIIKDLTFMAKEIRSVFSDIMDINSDLTEDEKRIAIDEMNREINKFNDYIMRIIQDMVLFPEEMARISQYSGIMKKTPFFDNARNKLKDLPYKMDKIDNEYIEQLSQVAT